VFEILTLLISGAPARFQARVGKHFRLPCCSVCPVPTQLTLDLSFRVCRIIRKFSSNIHIKFYAICNFYAKIKQLYRIT